MTKKLLFIAISLISIECIIYLYAAQITEILDMRFQLAARYSARLSFAMFSGLLLWIGIEGLKDISQYQNSRKLLSLWVAAIGINHLIHFYFLYQNHLLKGLNLFVLNSAGGSVAYGILIVLSISLMQRKEWDEWTKRMILGSLAVVDLVFCLAYIKRLFRGTEMASSNYYYISALIVIGVLLILNIYRLLEDGKKKPISSSLTQ